MARVSDAMCQASAQHSASQPTLLPAHFQSHQLLSLNTCTLRRRRAPPRRTFHCNKSRRFASKTHKLRRPSTELHIYRQFCVGSTIKYDEGLAEMMSHFSTILASDAGRSSDRNCSALQYVQRSHDVCRQIFTFLYLFSPLYKPWPSSHSCPQAKYGPRLNKKNFTQTCCPSVRSMCCVQNIAEMSRCCQVLAISDRSNTKLRHCVQTLMAHCCLVLCTNDWRYKDASRLSKNGQRTAFLSVSCGQETKKRVDRPLSTAKLPNSYATPNQHCLPPWQRSQNLPFSYAYIRLWLQCFKDDNASR